MKDNHTSNSSFYLLTFIAIFCNENENQNYCNLLHEYENKNYDNLWKENDIWNKNYSSQNEQMNK